MAKKNIEIKQVSLQYAKDMWEKDENIDTYEVWKYRTHEKKLTPDNLVELDTDFDRMPEWFANRHEWLEVVTMNAVDYDKMIGGVAFYEDEQFDEDFDPKKAKVMIVLVPWTCYRFNTMNGDIDDFSDEVPNMGDLMICYYNSQTDRDYEPKVTAAEIAENVGVSMDVIDEVEKGLEHFCADMKQADKENRCDWTKKIIIDKYLEMFECLEG